MRTHRFRAVTAATVALLTGVPAALMPAQAVAAPVVLNAVVGPGHTITLKNSSGRTVRSVKAGRAYTVVVRDKAKNHNFRLTGPGVSRSTSLRFVGTVRWTVKFRAGTYSFACDPHADMRGSFRAS